MSGLTIFVAQLFPWPILAAMIAYVSIGVGMATLRRVDAEILERRAARVSCCREARWWRRR